MARPTRRLQDLNASAPFRHPSKPTRALVPCTRPQRLRSLLLDLARHVELLQRGNNSLREAATGLRWGSKQEDPHAGAAAAAAADVGPAEGSVGPEGTAAPDAAGAPAAAGALAADAAAAVEAQAEAEARLGALKQQHKEEIRWVGYAV